MMVTHISIEREATASMLIDGVDPINNSMRSFLYSQNCHCYLVPIYKKHEQLLGNSVGGSHARDPAYPIVWERRRPSPR
jgi:hypothetical protein